ncbi:hypothetical protein T439DRAFT_320807 [Meredithblackwellia eburnea MCA 4105]
MSTLSAPLVVGVLGVGLEQSQRLTWALAVLGILFLAYMTNPNQSSFRQHLTSISFQSNLRRLSNNEHSQTQQQHQQQPSPANSRQESGINNQPSSSSTKSGRPRRSSSAASTGAPPTTASNSVIPACSSQHASALKPRTQRTAASHRDHAVSFSTRISLAIRTPVYTFNDYIFFSIALLLGPPPSSLTSVAKQQPLKDEPTQTTWWIGVFGRWYALRWDFEATEEKERSDRLRHGVKGIDVDEEDERGVPYNSDRHSSSSAENLTPSPPSHDQSLVASAVSLSTDHSPGSTSPSRAQPKLAISSTSSSRSSSNAAKKNFRPNNQRRAPSPASLARLRSKAEANSLLPTAASPTSTASSPTSTKQQPPSPGTHHSLQQQQDTDEFYDTTQHKGQPGLPFHIDDLAGLDPPTSAFAPSSHPSFPTSAASFDTASSPSTTTTPPPDPILDELQLQLAELRSTSEETEKRLLMELEVLRGKKKEEDAFRAELKGKTKGLEETKRVAEMARTEAEREANDRRAAVRERENKVKKLRGDIKAIDRREQEVVEKRLRKAKERKEREKKIREDVIKRKEDLRVAESLALKAEGRIKGLEKTIEARRELLHLRRGELNARSAIGGPFIGYPLQSAGNPYRTFAGGRPSTYPYGPQASSRPSSIRSTRGAGVSGVGLEYSPPASPHLASAVAPSSIDAGAAYAHSVGGASDPSSSRHPSGQGFLEHRLAHRRAEQAVAAATSTMSGMNGTLPSVDDIPLSFLPFDFEAAASSSRRNSHDDSHKAPTRPQLALPLQYLDSGLLAGTDSPGVEGPLSPMTPHQASLIPSQLFNMLDDDEEDDFKMPDSPTIGSHLGKEEWMGLGLDAVDLSQRHPDSSSTDVLRGTSSSVGVLPTSPPAIQSPAVASPISPFSPVSPMSDVSSSTADQHLTPYAPWDSSDQLVGTTATSPSSTHKQPLSSPHVHGAEDDLPRQGLSLNPGAKAFAFQGGKVPSLAPSPTVRSAGMPSPSAIAAAFNSVIEPPSKSRMEFSSTNQVSSAPPQATRFPYDWTSTPSSAEPSPSAIRPNSTAGTLSSAFNPFKGEDDILGPLKR